MALPRTRAFNIFEDDPGFNLGMTPEAFANLGLMSLAGANNTVANPAVAAQIAEKAVQPDPAFDPNSYQNLSYRLFGRADGPAPTVEDLYTTVLNRASDPEGLQFWTNKLGPTVQKNELEEFYAAAQPELAKTTSVSNRSSSPIIETVEARGAPTIPAQDMPPEPMEIIDREYLGPSTNVARQEVAAAQPAADTSGPKFEGKPYDPAAYNTVLKQLTAQQQALSSKGVPYTSTFGGAAETVQDMAKRLAAMGISDIRDFGMKHELPVEKVYETIQQDEGPAMTFDTGKYRTISGFKGYDAERNPIFDYRELTPAEVEKLRFDKEGAAFLPSDQIKRADLGNTPYATTKYYNKKTGEEIDTKQFGSKAESGLFASSGAGEGYTNYRVVYDEKTGTPVFIPEKELSGMKEFVAKDLPGILSVLSFIPGAAPFVTAAQLAGGLAAGVDPSKLLKSVGTSLLASNIGKIGNTLLPKIGFDLPTSDLGKLAMNAGYSGLGSLIRGGDLESALKSAGLSAVGSGISQLMPKVQPGEFDYGKILMSLAPALADGKLSNADIFKLAGLLATDGTKKNRPPGTP